MSPDSISTSMWKWLVLSTEIPYLFDRSFLETIAIFLFHSFFGTRNFLPPTEFFKVFPKGGGSVITPSCLTTLVPNKPHCAILRNPLWCPHKPPEPHEPLRPIAAMLRPNAQPGSMLSPTYCYKSRPLNSSFLSIVLININT